MHACTKAMHTDYACLYVHAINIIVALPCIQLAVFSLLWCTAIIYMFVQDFNIDLAMSFIPYNWLFLQGTNYQSLIEKWFNS